MLWEWFLMNNNDNSKVLKNIFFDIIFIFINKWIIFFVFI